MSQRNHRWTRSGLTLAAVFLLFAALASAQSTKGEYVERRTGIGFPAAIGSLRRWGVVSFAERDPGLGIAVRYTTNKGCRGDIFVYNLGLAEIPSDPDDQVIAQQLQQALGDIRTQERTGTYQDVSVQRSEVAHLGGAGSPKVRHAVLSYVERGKREESHLYVTGYKNHFIKIRFTFAEQVRESCLAALGELSGWWSVTLRK